MKTFTIANTLLLVWLALSRISPACAEPLTFQMTTREGVRHLLVSLPLPEPIRQQINTDRQWTVRAVDSPQRQPVQFRKADSGMLALWRPAVPLPAGTTQQFVLEPAESAIAPQFQVESTEAGLVVRRGDQPLLTYHERESVLPAGVDRLYARSGYVHPLLTPGGRSVTDDFAPDHRHQHGLFSAWVKTTVEGQTVDFWNQGKGEGTVQHRQTQRASGGPVAAELETELAHVRFLADEAAQDVLAETWQLLLHQSGELNLCEWTTRQVNQLSTPVTLDEHHYGGYAIRGARGWSQPPGLADVELVTDTAADRTAGNHTAARWVRMSGPLADTTGTSRSATVVMLAAPENPRSPQKVRLHPSKPYFCFCPVVTAPLVLEPGESLTNRFLIVTTDQSMSTAQWNQIAAEFQHPPQIEWLKH